MFIDRSGLKVSLQEQYTRHSKGALSLVLEQVRRGSRRPARLPHNFSCGHHFSGAAWRRACRHP